MRTRSEILDAFTAVKKVDPGQQARLTKIESAFKELSTDILDLVPESADRTVAMRSLLNAKFMCSQAITHPLQKGSSDVKAYEKD